MKNILIITNYFPPETGAASNRIHHLAFGLKQRAFNVSVITPLPNYPTGEIFDAYKGKFKHVSHEDGIKISRLWIFASNSKNKFLRLLAMLSYSLSLVWYFIWNKIPDTVIIQSPPLLVAFTCMLFLKAKKRKLILNVSDLWPIAGLELGALKPNFSYKMLERIERFNYRKANMILGQSEEILEHINGLYPDKSLLLYRNYPEFNSPELVELNSDSNKIKIVYAGLLGIAQGVLTLCRKLDYTNIEFHIYGAGAEREALSLFISEHPEQPIIFHGEVSRQKLHKVLLQYDIAIIPLRNRIYGSVPSKIFEYSKLGLPLIYFGGGEGETIINKHQLGWVAKAGNYEDLNMVISSLKKEKFTLEFKQEIKRKAINTFDFTKQLDVLEKHL